MRKNMNTDHRCIRGLEHMRSPAHFEQIRINADCVYSGVLREQQRQRMLGIHDPEEIEKISAAASLWARNVAFINNYHLKILSIFLKLYNLPQLISNDQEHL